MARDRACFAGEQREAQFIVTEGLMMLEMPHFNRLWLGDGLAAGFPAILQQLANPELLALRQQIDPTPNSPAETGADYWGDLPDRLHAVADLFRC